MKDIDGNAMPDASAAIDGADWLSRMQARSEEAGTFEPVGTGYHAVFLDNAPTLLVCRVPQELDAAGCAAQIVTVFAR